MKKFILTLLMLSSLNSYAGVKGGVGYDSTTVKTHTQIPYTVCSPTCQTVTNDYYSSNKENNLRLSLGYEYFFSDRLGLDVVAGTTPSMFDLRLETNLIVSATEKINLKAGMNRYQEKSSSGFTYDPGYGYQVGAEYKLAKNLFIEGKYLEMNTSYDINGSSSDNSVKKNGVSIGIGFSF